MKIVISVLFFSLLSGVTAGVLEHTVGPMPGWFPFAIGVPFGIVGFVVGMIWEEL